MSKVLLLLGSLLVAFLLRFEFMVPLVFWPRFALVAALYATLIYACVSPSLAAFIMLAVNLATGLVPNSMVIGGSVVFLLLHQSQIYRDRYRRYQQPMRPRAGSQ
jgi:hypothetical protein